MKECSSEDLTTALDEDYICPICTDIFQNPIQTACGHLFCQECLFPILAKPEPLCPIDRNPIDRNSVFPDNFLKRKIADLQNQLIKVCSCGERFHLKNQEKHQIFCKNRVVGCDFCLMKFPFKLKEQHERECGKIPVTCEFCYAIFPKGERENHRKYCKIQLCPLWESGCDFKGDSVGLSKHLQDSIVSHFGLLVQENSKLKKTIASLSPQSKGSPIVIAPTLPSDSSQWSDTKIIFGPHVGSILASSGEFAESVRENGYWTGDSFGEEWLQVTFNTVCKVTQIRFFNRTSDSYKLMYFNVNGEWEQYLKWTDINRETKWDMKIPEESPLITEKLRLHCKGGKVGTTYRTSWRIFVVEGKELI